MNATLKTEKAIARKLIRAIRSRGYVIGVTDGEEYFKCKTEREAMEVVFSVDESWLLVRGEGGERVGWFLLIGGNGEEFISDYAANEVCEGIVTEVFADGRAGTAEEPPREKMDLYFSVFNCHVNDAEKKAVTAYKEKYGEDVFERVIQPILDAGIMSIFDKPPTEETKAFATLIQDFVNEGRV